MPLATTTQGAGTSLNVRGYIEAQTPKRMEVLGADADNGAMIRASCIALLFLIVPGVSAQETNPSPPSTQTQSGANSSGSDVGGDARPAGASNSAPARVGPTIGAPKAIYTPDPNYPEAARIAGYQGTVVIWLIVDTDGTPKQIKVVRKLGMGLDEEAVAAVKKWRFKPATKDGQPVPVMINVEVNFRTGVSEPNLPLHSPAQAKGVPPQFPGADLRKYPLIVYVSDITPMPLGKRYEVRASASFDSGEQSNAMQSRLVCESNQSHCSLLWSGYYPARWIVENQKLELIGQKGNNKSWEKAEYVVQPASGR